MTHSYSEILGKNVKVDLYTRLTIEAKKHEVGEKNQVTEQDY